MPLLSIVCIMLKLGKERFNSFSLYLGWEKDISVSPPDFDLISISLLFVDVHLN